MRNQTLEYQNPLTGEARPCFIAQTDFGPCYCDQESGKQLFLYENPISRVLVGLDEDQVEHGHEQLKEELRERLQQIGAQIKSGSTAVRELAEAMSRTLAALDEPLSAEAEAVLNLPSDTRPGKNRARLRDHFLLTSGIAVALAQALLIKGHRPAEMASGLAHFDEREALALLRLAAMCHDIGKHPPRGHIERGQAFVRDVFADLLGTEIIDEIAEAVKRHHASRRHRLQGLAPESLMQEIICFADSVASGADRPGDPAFNFPGYDDVRVWERRYFGDETPLALIAADVDRVQGYVFESAKLPEMRGASLILDLLNIKDSDEEDRWGNLSINRRPIKGIPQVLADEFGLPRESIVYASGGGAMIIAPAARAEEIKRRIERLYIETTLTATTTVVYQPLRLRDLALGIDPIPLEHWFSASARQASGEAWRLLKHNLVIVSEDKWEKFNAPADLNDQHYYRSKRFGQLQTALGYKLRRAKQSKPTAPLFEVSPFTERCAYCQFRPAYKLSSDVDERPICQVCDRKRQRQARSFYINQFIQYLRSEAKQSNELPYLSGVKQDRKVGDWHEIESPPDLEAVAEAGATRAVRNYIGIIYADGNDMGAKLDGLETPAAFKSFAEDVRSAIEGAVFNGLGTLLDGHRTTEREEISSSGQKHKRTLRYHPFEIVSIGGDDVYLFVPADIALELALHICREFEKAFNRALTLSAGVLLAHVNTPIYFSRTIVKGLLRNAKTLGKAGDSAISAVDFQTITADTAASESIPQFRQRAYCNQKFPTLETLTMRPLTLDQFQKMIEVVRTLKQRKTPKSQLYALRDAVVRGPQPRATNYYNYQRARSDELKKAYEPLHEYLKQLSSDDRFFPFFKPGGQSDLVTAIVDLVEIYDFVRATP
ncbi:MAG: HD domain-containing protein [Acidobacteriota bacterium]|nr:HD domain-containing protein [Blastocatellia bacterium]MDW8241426.1 HD domain-containing protein [Acidobacteriota bacterium]